MTLNQLIHITCKQMDITRDQLVKKNRNRTMIIARTIISKIGYDHLRKSKSEIGKSIKRDHSTIINSIDNHTPFYSVNWYDYKKHYDDIETQVIKMKGGKLDNKDLITAVKKLRSHIIKMDEELADIEMRLKL